MFVCLFVKGFMDCSGPEARHSLLSFRRTVREKVPMVRHGSCTQPLGLQSLSQFCFDLLQTKPNTVYFYGLQKTWLQPKFEVSNSRNKIFSIMVPGFYLGFYLKYAIFEFKMSSQEKSTPAILTGSKKHGCSQNLKSLTQKTQILA